MAKSTPGRLLILTAALWAIPAPAAAQTFTPPDPAAIPVLLGPLWITPRLALGNAGIDTNVFNQPDQEGPERDITITVIPSAELWLRMGRTWLTGTVREDIVWFKEFVSERSVNSTLRGAWVVPLTRFSFNLGAGWRHTRERPGFEIDARADRREADFNAAAEVRVLSRTRFGVRGERRSVEFEEGEVFLGTDLREELTRTATAAAVTVRHELTPLTTLLINLAREQDRFEYSPQRDTNTQRVDLGLEFDPFALIAGTARLGFRSFDPLASDVPGYSGATFSGNVTYVALGSTRLAVQALRDVEYSFDINQPYYLQTGFGVSLAQQIYGPIDAEARVGAQRLAYRAREDTDAIQDRVDRVRSYGFGTGYHVGRDLRVGFNVDHQRRTSDEAVRAYDGLRYGLAVTYGR